jgi:hypothetical protein
MWTEDKIKWIQIKERFPEIGERVLVYAKNGVHGGHEIDIQYRQCKEYWNEQGLFCTITHWMPLPEKPDD